MEGLFRHREQQVQSGGEAVWAVLVGSSDAQHVWWGWGMGRRPAKQHLVGTWQTGVLSSPLY